MTDAGFYRLRIATPDDSCALSVLAASVPSATGLPVEPTLQEIDRRQLIVEVRVTLQEALTPTQLAYMVQRACTHLEVLSGWRESRSNVSRCSGTGAEVVFFDDLRLPPVARRAFDDRLPTAGWQHRPGDVPHWLLAVPGVDADGRMMAAVARRNGYYHRFLPTDALSLRASLAA